MFSLDLFEETATAAVGMLGEECALVEEHIIQNGLQEVDRSLAHFDETSPTSPFIPGYELLPRLPGKSHQQLHVSRIADRGDPALSVCQTSFPGSAVVLPAPCYATSSSASFRGASGHLRPAPIASSNAEHPVHPSSDDGSHVSPLRQSHHYPQHGSCLQGDGTLLSPPPVGRKKDNLNNSSKDKISCSPPTSNVSHFPVLTDTHSSALDTHTSETCVGRCPAGESYSDEETINPSIHHPSSAPSHNSCQTSTGVVVNSKQPHTNSSTEDTGPLSPGKHKHVMFQCPQPSSDLGPCQPVIPPSTEGEVREESSDTNDVCDIKDYADKFFNDHERDSGGTLMKTLKKRKQAVSCEFLSREEMLRYCKSGIMPSSLTHLHDFDNVHIACNIFKDLTRYIRDELKDEAAITTLQHIVRCGINRIELRDEIFCQLVRQTNDNPEVGSLRHAWAVMCLCTASFSPSKNLHKYLLSYVQQNCCNTAVQSYALTCRSHLTSTPALTRKYPPSSIEIMSVVLQNAMICKVHFMDGKTKAVSLLPRDTTVTVLEKVASRIDLQSVDGWALYEVTKDYERYIKDYEYIADVLAQWEIADRLSGHTSKNDSLSRRGQKMAAGGAEARLVFRKRVYRHVADMPDDPVEYHLLYAEAVNKVVKLDDFCVSEKTALQLAGLQAQVIWGHFEGDKEFRYTEADQYLCKRILTASGKNWPQHVARAHKHYGGEKSELDAKMSYLNCVQRLPLYGCLFFPVTHTGLWLHTAHTLLAVNMDGVKFVRSKDKAILHEFTYQDMDSISVDPHNRHVTLELSGKKETGGVQKTFMFETRHKEDLGQLIAVYSPPHAFRMKTDYDAWKKGELTDEEKLKLYEDLLQCRKVLSDSQLLQPPAQDNSTGFLRNTLRRLGKTRQDKIRSSGSTETDSSFTAEYWSFSKALLRQSLTLIPNPALEDIAIKMFNNILLCSGVEHSGDSDADLVSLCQSVMQKSLDSDCLADEFYLQLIKQTTDLPDSNSAMTRRCWQLLTVLCVTMPPPNSAVFRYLQVHLQKSAMDLSSQDGKFARFALKCLIRTMEKKRRKFAPSVREIHCVIQRQLISQRVCFLNGESCVVDFDSAATCGEVIRTVKVKMGMRSDADSFALYEVITGSSSHSYRGLSADDRMSDILSKWERLSRTGGGTEFRLDFKKRLFIDPYVNLKDPVECDLVFHQLIQDVFEERIPVTPAEAAQLCALKIQSERETLRTDDINYSSVMRILPRGMRSGVRVEDIMTSHRKVLDSSPQQAVVAFINVLKAWSLFGVTLFPVSQSYSSSLPKNLLLGVHERGVSLLELHTFKVLTSFSFAEIVQTTPSSKNIGLVILGSSAKGSKLLFSSTEASQIAQLVRDYMMELQARYMLAPSQNSQSLPPALQIHQLERQNTTPQSIE